MKHNIDIFIFQIVMFLLRNENIKKNYASVLDKQM